MGGDVLAGLDRFAALVDGPGEVVPLGLPLAVAASRKEPAPVTVEMWDELKACRADLDPLLDGFLRGPSEVLLSWIGEVQGPPVGAVLVLPATPAGRAIRKSLEVCNSIREVAIPELLASRARLLAGSPRALRTLRAAPTLRAALGAVECTEVVPGERLTDLLRRLARP